MFIPGIRSVDDSPPPGEEPFERPEDNFIQFTRTFLFFYVAVLLRVAYEEIDYTRIQDYDIDSEDENFLDVHGGIPKTFLSVQSL